MTRYMRQLDASGTVHFQPTEGFSLRSRCPFQFNINDPELRSRRCRAFLTPGIVPFVEKSFSIKLALKSLRVVWPIYKSCPYQLDNSECKILPSASFCFLDFFCVFSTDLVKKKSPARNVGRCSPLLISAAELGHPSRIPFVAELWFRDLNDN